MADLNDIAVFARVAQFESFSRAARALGMPVSTVSRKVTALEERLGVTLQQRTTRKLSLTAQGRAYYTISAPSRAASDGPSRRCSPPSLGPCRPDRRQGRKPPALVGVLRPTGERPKRLRRIVLSQI